MSNNVNSATSGLQQSLDTILGFGTRALEGFYNFKLLNTELKAQQAAVQWQIANNQMLYGQQVGNGGSVYGVQGVNGISSVQQAGMFGGGNQMLIVVGVAVALGIAFFSSKD